MPLRPLLPARPGRSAPPRRRVVVAGRYRLGEELGRGATGVVHRAEDLRSGRQVAVKMLRRARDAGDPTAVLRFVREQQHRIRHPHVLAPLGWAADDEMVLIAMELVEGGSMADLLAMRATLSEAEVARLLGQLLAALDAVHARGVVHGDVKPANLLLRDLPAARPHLLLADFGIATRLGSHGLAADRPAGPEGTPGFLPPEALAGAPPHPSRDVYAAGVVARRALARPGPLSTLCDSMTRDDPRLRPTAADARARVAELVPTARPP